ncbi:MAG: MBL fold metallo-hydrolase [Candidatus Eisenbacteria bacterium]|uniref:MBL fold metallo-hydrolase n=1 Tax=Eiseniibacteriota bacterium TaxID=2212470 RepID=A0A538TKR1_UNCEI|nr:MAG: MBL fold metallo-hydrolase [Candidatus Eisenbacteria bacterium]
MIRFTPRRPVPVRHLLPLLLLGLLAGPVHAQTTYLPGAEPPTKQKAPPDSVITIEVHSLAPGVYAAKVNYVWTGWVELPGGPLLIDSGLDERTAAALADTIRARSGPKPVQYVVNTHAHGDHIGGNAYFAASGATIIAQSKVAAKIDSTTKASKPSLRVDRKKFLGPVDRKVEILWLGKPAHTSNDLIVYLPKQKVLFAGDLISNKAIPLLLDPNFDRLGWIASVDSLMSKAFVFDKLIPGHGVLADPVEEVRFTRGYLTDSYDKAARVAAWGTSLNAVKDWAYLGPYEDAEFYNEVHFLNMRRLYNQARGIKTPGRSQARTIKR